MKQEFTKKLKIPSNPGVYFFRRGKEILYIGKATELKSRIKSYLRKDPEGKQASYGAGLIETRGPLIAKMVQETNNLKWQTTDSVLEALILEAELIKKHQPRYNTKEKDDKSFNYVAITKEELPRVMILRERELPEIKNFSGLTLPRVQGGTHTIRNFQLQAIFGPFPNGSQLTEALKIIRRIFPYLDDKSKNYAEFYRQINLVPDLNDRKMYLENIKNIKLFFVGKKKRILQNLKKEMNLYVQAREFEKAGEIKRQIFALKHINDVALLKKHKDFSGGTTFRIEAYDVAHMSGRDMVGVMTVVEDGQAQKSEYKKFKIRTQKNSNDTGALKEVLNRRLAHPEWPYPNLIVVDGGLAQMNLAQSVLNLVGVKIPIVSVLKDEYHRPKGIKGGKRFAIKYEQAILLSNSEAHRFAIAYHKNIRAKNFIK